MKLISADKWRPPERLSLSGWAEKKFYLSQESAAATGRFRPYPFQRGIMDALTNPEIERVTWLKSARVGATKIMNALVGYYMEQDPCPIMVVQPTLDDARGYSKEEISPMLRDCPSLAAIFDGNRYKAKGDTLLHKIYPGGSISIVGANSGTGFRRVSRKIVICDEVDGYPLSAGDDGDPVSLAIRRSEHYWDRKIFLGSTPLIESTSRIIRSFLEGDQRSYYVPCPHCGRFDFLVFEESVNGGHHMTWTEGKPEHASFVCHHGCGRSIDAKAKHDMVDAGVWRPKVETKRHASFTIWAAYSFSPNAQWGHIAAEYEAAVRHGPQKVRTFVNTVLGKGSVEEGEAPDWERLHARREKFDPEEITRCISLVTCGVDVQKNRVVYEVVGWDEELRSWSLEYNEVWGDPQQDEVWQELEKLFAREWFGHSLRIMAVDSGYLPQEVYNFARRHPGNRVIAVKGKSKGTNRIIGSPTKVDVTFAGKPVGRIRLYMVGTSLVKEELYGWLGLARKDEAYPRGYCRFPMYDEKYFMELTAEHLVGIEKRDGIMAFEWHKMLNRENHVLDCRVYARAAAALVGIGRQANRGGQAPAKAVTAKAAPIPTGEGVVSSGLTIPRAKQPAPRGYL